MKKMTCRQLGGACDEVFYARTFEEMAHQSKQHGMEMMKKGDKPHMNVMAEMQKLMASPADMQQWMAKMKQAFDKLPSM
jgi:hypothetical protein